MKPRQSPVDSAASRAGGGRAFHGPNAGYVAELYERYLHDPASVDGATRTLFDTEGDTFFEPGPAGVPLPAESSALDLVAAAEVASLAQAIRLFGHLAAQLDPLGSAPPGDPQLDPASHGVSADELDRLPASVVAAPLAAEHTSAGGAIADLRDLYCGSTGYEFAHVADPGERSWLFQAVESRRYCPPADADTERNLLDRLTEVSAFERFLHRAYPGQTRFSVEGLGMMIPMLDELVDRAAEAGVRTIFLGMAHRGRLNVLAHVLGKPYEQIIAEFEGLHPQGRSAGLESEEGGWAGDVKYHAGGQREAGTVTVIMAPNPSHLEFVNPVVEGMARAADEDRFAGPGAPRQDEVASLAVLIHGDAAFPAQGVVAETFTLSRLPGYRTGGTVHLIANNQLGFTTELADARSTLYASDLAKGFEVPVIHVNADDPSACLAAVRLAVAYRAEFSKDVLVDLVGYRRWGHNEGDEPSFTQPALYATIGRHPTVREQYGAALVERGIVGPEEPESLLKAGLDEFQRIREGVQARKNGRSDATISDQAAAAEVNPENERAAPPRLSLERLRDLNRALTELPEGFSLNPKLEKPLQRRRAAFADDPDAPIDWGHAEALALGMILQDGVPVRLVGQDSVRGTFSQRHASFFDARTGQPYTPLASLPGVRACFDVRNSPLSEAAVLGFEYGYSVQAAEALVLWEAQYGDFINGAQVIVDEFVASGQAKWGLRSGLVLLLPHAWEGQGPDHSSGRLERFLELAAEDNLWIANCSTAAQYFHLLRQQAASLQADPRPLIVMTPKGLLRHQLTASRAAELVDGSFAPLLASRARTGDVRRVVLCTGHIWVDLTHQLEQSADASTAIVRVEQLYPFPARELRELLADFDRAEEVVWAQEETENMGAWRFVRVHLEALAGRLSVGYAGRPAAASPAEGWADVHASNQRLIVEQALGQAAAKRRSAAKSPSRRKQ